MSEKCYGMFWRKEDLVELPEDSMDVFQCNMLDHYTILTDQIQVFRMANLLQSIIDLLCFAEFLSYCNVQSKSKPELQNDC